MTGPDTHGSKAPLRASRHLCRACGAALRHTFVDLGSSPPCESFLEAHQLAGPETFLPLRPGVCERCFLVQLPELISPRETFTEYAYFSSYSQSWLRHAERFVADAVQRFGLGPHSRVVEVASNDGYLLQYFVQRGIPALGVEPAANVAAAAREKGVRTEVRFLDEVCAREIVERDGRADLVIGNNVLAQVPDLRGFVRGLSILLAPGGTLTLEFPHLLRLMEENQFDTIYHEHFSYFSLLSLIPFLESEGLVAVDVEELATHGGSLRLHLRHAEAARPGAAPLAIVEAERRAGLDRMETYADFEERVREVKRALLVFLIEARRKGRRVVGYGAPGKGNTLLNYCGIRTDLLDFTVDRNPYKQGRYTPGTRIPILPPEALGEARPDYVLILPWNLRDEIVAQESRIGEWGGRFVVPIPALEVIEARPR